MRPLEFLGYPEYPDMAVLFQWAVSVIEVFSCREEDEDLVL
jgi:hypothetical protein